MTCECVWKNENNADYIDYIQDTLKHDYPHHILLKILSSSQGTNWYMHKFAEINNLSWGMVLFLTSYRN